LKPKAGLLRNYAWVAAKPCAGRSVRLCHEELVFSAARLAPHLHATWWKSLLA